MSPLEEEQVIGLMIYQVAMQQVVVLAGGEPQLVVKTMDWQPILHALLDIQMFFAVFVQLMVALVQ